MMISVLPEGRSLCFPSFLTSNICALGNEINRGGFTLPSAAGNGY
jgi:hypothetical protein